MLEFGLVAGERCEAAIASRICQYGCAEMPSDLAGMTVIRIGSASGRARIRNCSGNRRSSGFDSSGRSRLIATAEGIPRTQTVHGYTGRWDIDICLPRVGGIFQLVVNPGYVQIKGHLDLYLPPERAGGPQAGAWAPAIQAAGRRRRQGTVSGRVSVRRTM